ncbi:MAG: type II toxin-antitoxin system RelB/DinJ family antitoxin [Cardiobacteriaceae bacterium]|nr:type II toxin-antitoxin system RelB/DinJ family antitoxin [Cardiobacteriaceae bacterium]
MAINYSVRIDEELKNKAFPIIESYGLTPAQLIKLIFHQIAETRVIPLSFDYLAKKSSEENEDVEVAKIESKSECHS